MTLDGAAAQAWRDLPDATKAEIRKQLLAALHTDCTQVGTEVHVHFIFSLASSIEMPTLA